MIERLVLLVRAWLPHLLLVVAVLAAPALAHAQPSTDLDARYQRGRERFAAGDIQGALDDYRAVFAARPEALVAGNLGNAAYQLGLYAEAAEALRWGLRHLAADDPRQEKFQQRYDQARSKAGALQVTVEPSEATVLVDGAVVELGAEPTYVMPGPRRIEARLEGYQTKMKELEVPPGVTTEVAITLAPESSRTSEPLPVPAGPGDGGDREQDATVQLAAGIGTIVVGAGGIAAGIGLLVVSENRGEDAVAQQQRVDSDRRVTSNPCGEGPVAVEGCAELEAALADQQSLRAGGIVSLGLGALVAAGGMVWLIVAHASDDPESVALLPVIAPQRGGLVAGLKGAF